MAISGVLYNFVVDEHSEYQPILNKNFPTDWRNKEPPGSPGWYLEPLYSYFEGVLSATVNWMHVACCASSRAAVAAAAAIAAAGGATGAGAVQGAE